MSEGKTCGECRHVAYCGLALHIDECGQVNYKSDEMEECPARTSERELLEVLEEGIRVLEKEGGYTPDKEREAREVAEGEPLQPWDWLKQAKAITKHKG